MSILVGSGPECLQVACNEFEWWGKHPSEWSKRVDLYRKETNIQGHDWCSIFIHWVMKQVGLPGSTSWNNRGPAAACSWLNWGTPLTIPRKGAVAILSDGRTDVKGWEGVPWYHVTLYDSTLGTNSILALGGNQDHRVKYKQYKDLKAIQYRWPLFAVKSQDLSTM